MKQGKLIIDHVGEYYKGAEIELVCAPPLGIGLHQIRERGAGLPTETRLYLYGMSWGELRAFALELLERIDKWTQ